MAIAHHTLPSPLLLLLQPHVAPFPIPIMLSTIALAIFLFLLLLRKRPLPVYMLHFTCFKPHASEKLSLSLAELEQRLKATEMFSQESLDFQRKVLERSGLGDETYGPPALVRSYPKPDMSMAGSRMEAEMVLFGAIDDLLAKTGVEATDVDILVVNCGLFAPNPSLCSMVMNRYKMREDVRAFNLSGMGCSAGVVATDLARRVLSAGGRRGGGAEVAMVITMENITQSGYAGNDRSKLLPNCIFRMGGSACILSNGRSGKWCRPRYELVHTVRTHMGADDGAYRSVYMEEDEAGQVGVTLSKELKVVAATLLRTHMLTLGPLVLPISEILKFCASFAARSLGLAGAAKLRVPDFTRAFQHVCVHAGGKAVLDKLQESLRLGKWHMEPSRMTLYRFGNTSSSSPWYEFAYLEAAGRVARGHRIWQLSFGSGFKCNSAVWKSLAAIPPKEPTNPWSDFIDKCPIDVPSIRALS